MNIWNKVGKISYKFKIGFRLWVNMMLLVLLSVIFMWIVQIHLFEQNYIDVAVTEISSNLAPVIDDIEGLGIDDDETLLVSLSKAADGKVLVVDSQSRLLQMFSSGHRLIDQASLESGSRLVAFTKTSLEYESLEKGQAYDRIIRYNDEPIGLEIGLPISYKGQAAKVIIYHKLDQLHTVLKMNRIQLIWLSIILTLVASVIAALLTQHFLKPIRKIKTAVDRLAEGDLRATPDLDRGDELGDLSSAVDALSGALQRVDLLRKEVISNVSHELKSPLSLIRGYAEMVRDISWADAEKRSEDLNLIIEASSRMSAMVTDIMDYSQIQAGYLNLKIGDYDLLEIIKSEVAFSRQDAKAYDIEIDLQIEGEVFLVQVDALKMCQIVRNLLSNAINHTEDGACIVVVLKDKDSEIEVQVINPGEPIPEEEQKHIWERYQRVQHQGGRNQGTGIGLSIVSSYLQAHEIEYGVKCQNGLTTFWFKYFK